MAESTKQRNIRKQLAPERDFADAGQPTFQYAICCGHRTGSNMLSEALYRTGKAGDPMEYFNLGFLREYCAQKGIQELNIPRFMGDLQSRRTSPNGVFGLNIKYDQLQICFKKNLELGYELIRRSNFIIFLYRKNKLRQAVSAYKGQVRDVFNVMRDDDPDALRKDTEVPFDPARISQLLDNAIKHEQGWLNFFSANNLDYYMLAYEDFIEDYAGYIADISAQMNIPLESHEIPEEPTLRTSDETNDRLVRDFLSYVGAALEL